MNLAENMLRIQESGHAGLSVANFLEYSFRIALPLKRIRIRSNEQAIFQFLLFVPLFYFPPFFHFFLLYLP
jgi:hypothetical protein